MEEQAFGAPGAAPTWCSSDKDFITTALGPARLWATIGHGIVNEVYWPSTGEPQIRDMGFYLVGPGRWIDLKRERRYRLERAGPALPLVTVVHHGADYELELEMLPDPCRDVLMVRHRLAGPYQLVVILAPHLGSSGRDNRAWIDGDHAYACAGAHALCLAAEPSMTQASCGFVGSSDGWQDLSRHGRPTYGFRRADGGTVAITATLGAPEGVIALGFADSDRGARTLARSSLAEGIDSVRQDFLKRWRRWGRTLRFDGPDERLSAAACWSATVLKMHEDRAYPGAMVASLSVPWGNTTDTLGGYHLVWPRDATLCAFAMLAANQRVDARRTMAHLIASQAADGHWPQNYYPSGEAFWTGLQLDESALPVLLAAKLAELGEPDLPGTAQAVRAAVAWLARTGPSSEQDRWEENPGINPFTIATVIAALVAAAPWLEPAERRYAEALADDWNERLESWCYVRDTALAREHGVQGYYVRLGTAQGAGEGAVTLRNRGGEPIERAALVSLDFSYLVRLGLRDARDERIVDTLRVVDAVLRVQTPSGGLYHRYQGDGYGEQSDGRSFDGEGIGRAWPLLVGERGHLALQAGEDPLPYLETMWNCASIGGLLPEQAWEADPIPVAALFPGRPSGSAMPLAWAHAEFLKLLVARSQGRPIEQLQSVARHFSRPPRATCCHWRTDAPFAKLARGRTLAVEDREPFTLHYGFDGWQGVTERAASMQPFGLWAVYLPATQLRDAGRIDFTRRYADRWEGSDHGVQLVP